MPAAAVFNASPIIALHKIGALGLIPSLYDKCLITTDVLAEIGAGENSTAVMAETKNLRGVEIISDIKVPEELMEWNLGKGETSVIAAALMNPGLEVILDDRAAARCARLYRLHVRGTIGFLLLAKREGKIKEVGQLLQALVKNDFWISTSLIRKTLETAGEK